MRGVRMVGTIGYNVPMSMWDAKRKQFKKGVANSDGVDSDIIKSRLSDIESHFNNLELRTTEKFTMEQLRAELAKAIAKNQAKLAAINDGASEEVIEKKEAEAEKKERMPKVKPAAEYMDEFIREESRLASRNGAWRPSRWSNLSRTTSSNSRKPQAWITTTRTALTNSSLTSVPTAAWRRTPFRSSTRISPGSSVGPSEKATPGSAT